MIKTYKIDELKRTITPKGSEKYPSVVIGDKDINGIEFEFPDSFEHFDLYAGVKYVSYVTPDGQEKSKLLTDIIPETGLFFWKFDDSINKGKPGQVTFALIIDQVESGETVKTWVSLETKFSVVKSLAMERRDDPEEEVTYAERLAAAETALANMRRMISGLASGAPAVAPTAAAMTDTEVIYIYTGSETGYSSGHLYYYDGSAWVDFGQYGSAAPDPTLSIQGAPADAAAVGEALEDIGDDIEDIKEDLSAIQMATTEDVGKALKAKTVTNGKVTEWEFGDAGTTIELDATLTDPTKAAQAKVVGDAVSKTVTAVREITFTGNIVDNTNARISGKWVYDLKMHHSDGIFYSNPLVMNMGFMNASPCDADGNTIPFVGSSATEIRIGSASIYKWEINGLDVTVTEYTSLDNFINNIPAHPPKLYTLSAKPDYWKASGKTLSGTATSLNYGMTEEPSETYIPYSDPIISDKFEYANELNEHIGGIADASLNGLMAAGGDDVGKIPRIKAVVEGKVTGWEFDNDGIESSCNLIDESQFDWTPVGGYWTLKEGYFFPVTAGKKICTNVAKPSFKFYDTGYVQIGQGSTVNPYALVSIPSGVGWCRMSINTNSNTLSDIQGKIMVYESDATSNDDVRDYVPPTKITGNLVEGDIYDTAKPLSLDIDILTASQYRAVRALNSQRNAFRIGTFNIFVTRGQYHWGALKQELKDYSLDICAMQEVSNSVDKERYVQNFLTMNTWQFKHGSQAVFNDTLTDKAIVSVYEIVSTELFTHSTGRTYIKTVINLPQYKRNAHQFTLSVYSAHLNLTASNRLIEASEILATVAQDTSDFIVICMDSNTFKTEMDAQGKYPTWETFISAGFTPIHYGEYSTITDMRDSQQSIDQIFMGANVSLIDYDIVNSNDYLVTIGSQELPISDHCMVYADLQFDFDAVLRNLQ